MKFKYKLHQKQTLFNMIVDKHEKANRWYAKHRNSDGSNFGVYRVEKVRNFLRAKITIFLNVLAVCNMKFQFNFLLAFQ